MDFLPSSTERGTRHSVNQMFYSRIGRVEKFKHGSKNFLFCFLFILWMFAITYRVANTADFNSRGRTVSLSHDFTSRDYSVNSPFLP